MRQSLGTEDTEEGWTRETYHPVPLSGLAGRDPLPFPLYLETGDRKWVLYRDVRTEVNDEHLGRLQAEGVRQLFVRGEDRKPYWRRVEGSLDSILRDRTVALDQRVDVLHGVAAEVAEDLLRARPDRKGVQRARGMMLATSGLLLREKNGFKAIRRVLAATESLAHHSLTVSFLSMGLARHVLGAEPNVLLIAGLAGLLHDVGRIGHDERQHDPEHTRRGADYLRSLDVPTPVCEAALHHHERFDGTGFPDGLVGQQIPQMARVVGLANTFDRIYSMQQPRVGIFDALRILAQAYRGCFDDDLAKGFVQLFRG